MPDGLPIPGFLPDQEIERARERGELEVAPFTDGQLTPVGYNLSFTWFIYSVNFQSLTRVFHDQASGNYYCDVRPNDTVLILTREAVWVSENIAGTFHSKVGIVSKGFGHISTTLDPKWEGPLLISLNNPTNRPLRLTIATSDKEGIHYQTFATLIFFRMAAKAVRLQDNLEIRKDLLLEIHGKLPRKPNQAIARNAIGHILEWHQKRIDIGAVPAGDERQKRIEQFRRRYEGWSNDLNSHIREAMEATNSISNDRRYRYLLTVIPGTISIAFILRYGWLAYLRGDSDMLALLALIVAVVAPICIRTEKWARDQWL